MKRLLILFLLFYVPHSLSMRAFCRLLSEKKVKEPELKRTITSNYTYTIKNSTGDKLRCAFSRDNKIKLIEDLTEFGFMGIYSLYPKKPAECEVYYIDEKGSRQIGKIILSKPGAFELFYIDKEKRSLSIRTS